ncbi:hypothetical protein BGX31_009032 [Mortierella sp. GBA43]|nr:hypothetical protein BGX31_009032 [Mortierella sp. GBA43]
MDGVDCDWCLVCEKHTAEGETYCSDECRSTDLMSSSASSSSSSASTESAYFSNISGSPASSTASSFNDNYQMPPFVRKQRTSIPNIYAHCTSNPNPPPAFMFGASGNGASALSHHLQQQQQQQQKQGCHEKVDPQQQLANGTTGATAYPLFYATLNALRPASPSGQHQ